MQDEHDDSLPGQDSFIDVICNMVGILIILVMIVGMQASRAPANLPEWAAAKLASLHSAKEKPELEAKPASTPAPSDAELDDALAKVRAAEQEIETNVVRAVDLRVQSELIEARRHQLSVVQAAVEQEIYERRAKLDGEAQKQFDVQRDIVTARIKLNELTQEQLSLLANAPEAEEIECVPTPIAKTVTGEEIHIRLKNKMLAVVPVDELLNEVKRRGDYLRSGIRERDSASDVYGPIDGFRMRMSIGKFEAPPDFDSPLPQPRRVSVVLQGVFLPTADELGQPVEQALLPNSAFMQTLRARRSTAPTVTAWTYPDSYAELRTLKRALWEAGVPLAVRALDNKQPIVFSTIGSKSAAQ